MSKTICRILGAAFVAAGLIGIVMPNLAGLHLNTAHNVVHLVSGLAAIWFGFNGSLNACKNFCLAFGAIYGLLGLVGLLVGPSMLVVIPGMLHFGIMDNTLHLIVGAVFLLGGLSNLRTFELLRANTAVETKEAKIS